MRIGLGYRREFAEDLQRLLPSTIDFLELAPENWIKIGGKRQCELTNLHEHYPLVAHGLSLSIGGPRPLNEPFLQELKKFFDHYNISIYTEHLSYCGAKSHIYDLLPMPFCEEAIHYIASRIRRVEDILERPIALENISYYATPMQELTELEFINGILTESQCGLLLDVNNIYVNSINQNYDAKTFLKSLKPKHIPYIHVAGHNKRSEDFILDSHGSDIIDPVWDLLNCAYQQYGLLPTVLERDNNIPTLNRLLKEVDIIRDIQTSIDKGTV